jgi:hypothetical protein
MNRCISSPFRSNSSSYASGLASSGESSGGADVRNPLGGVPQPKHGVFVFATDAGCQFCSLFRVGFADESP